MAKKKNTEIVNQLKKVQWDKVSADVRKEYEDIKGHTNNFASNVDIFESNLKTIHEIIKKKHPEALAEAKFSVGDTVKHSKIGTIGNVKSVNYIKSKDTFSYKVDFPETGKSMTVYEREIVSTKAKPKAAQKKKAAKPAEKKKVGRPKKKPAEKKASTKKAPAKKEPTKSKKSEAVKKKIEACRDYIKKHTPEKPPQPKPTISTAIGKAGLSAFRKAAKVLKKRGETAKIGRLQAITQNFVSDVKKLVTGSGEIPKGFADELDELVVKYTSKKKVEEKAKGGEVEKQGERILTTRQLHGWTDEEIKAIIPAGSYRGRKDGEKTVITDGAITRTFIWKDGEPVVQKAKGGSIKSKKHRMAVA